MKRQITTLELTASARQAIDRIAEQTGMRKKDVLERLLTWLADQDSVVQTCVLGLWPAAIAPDIARLVLEKVANQAEGADSSTPPGKSDSLAATPRLTSPPTRRRVRLTKPPTEV